MSAKLLIGVVIALAASVVVNLLLFNRWMDARAEASAAREALNTAMAAATTCDRAVQTLQEAAKRQAEQSRAALEEAKKLRETKDTAAELERQRPQAVPGDACASVEAETRDWMKRRREGGGK